jgi:hypothetical protein
MREIVKLHGVPREIALNRDPKFTSIFWKILFKGLGTNLNFITTYNPKLDAQRERVNRVIEDMLRMYVMDKPSKWEDYLHLAEVSYNNGYNASLKISPFKTLYGRKWNTQVIRDNLAERALVMLEFLREMEE